MIEINNLTETDIEENFLKKIASQVLGSEKTNKEAELSIALIGPGRMRKLNKKYRGKNKVTDVLAFPETRVAFEKFKIGPLAETKGLGEIVICVREVKKNAKRTGSAIEKEIATCLIHGVLHLLGYDHEKSEQEAEKMRKKEQFYIEKIEFS